MAICFAVLAVSALPVNAEMGVWRDINPDAYISPPANPQLNSIYMLSSSEGWAVGDSLPSSSTGAALPAIFHYDGTTWNLVPAPKFLSGFSSFVQHAYNLTSVTFGPPNSPISKNDGWAVGFNDTYSACRLLVNRFRCDSLGWDNVASAECRVVWRKRGTIVVCVHG